MSQRDPAVLLSIDGPSGNIDIAALTSTTPRRLATELAGVIGAAAEPITARLVRVGQQPTAIAPDQPLGAAGALDGDTLSIGSRS